MSILQNESRIFHWVFQHKVEDTSPFELNEYFRWKGMIDRALAVLLLLPALPLIGVLILVVRLTSRGPGIYSQNRVGKNGEMFTMYKIRSMRIDAERETGPMWTQSDEDSRITKIGRILRNLHLDELPQLFNVIRGEMSLIGPRPERPEFVAVLAEEIPGYMNRLAVLPGITGLAQINLPPDRNLEDVRRKLVLDREYIEHGDFLLEIRMLICTFLHVLGLKNDRAVCLLGLHRDVKRPHCSKQYRESGSSVLVTPETIIPESVTPKSVADVEAAEKALVLLDGRIIDSETYQQILRQPK